MHADSVRLVGSTAQNSGRVEVLSRNSWAAITNTRFGDQDAAVVCRHLGFTGGYAAAVPNNFRTSSSGAAWVTSMECAGEQHQSGQQSAVTDVLLAVHQTSLEAERLPSSHPVPRCATRRHRARVQRVLTPVGRRPACATVRPK